MCIKRYNKEGFFPSRHEIAETLQLSYTQLSTGGNILDVLLNDNSISEKLGKTLDSGFVVTWLGDEIITEYYKQFSDIIEGLENNDSQLVIHPRIETRAIRKEIQKRGKFGISYLFHQFGFNKLFRLTGIFEIGHKNKFITTNHYTTLRKKMHPDEGHGTPMSAKDIKELVKVFELIQSLVARFILILRAEIKEKQNK